MDRTSLSRTRGKTYKYGEQNAETSDDSADEDMGESLEDTTSDDADDEDVDSEYWDHLIASSKVVVKKLFEDFKLPFADGITQKDVLEELVMLLDSFCKKPSETN